MDIGDLQEEVFEHSRLIALMNELMNSGRGIWEIQVFRRVRLMQLASLTNSARTKLVYIRDWTLNRDNVKSNKDDKVTDHVEFAPLEDDVGIKKAEQLKWCLYKW